MNFLHVPYKKDNYYLIQILNFLEALDYKNSVFDTYSIGGVHHIYKHAFRKDVIGDIPIFKLRNEDYPYMSEIYVSDAFKEKVEEEGLTGFKFVEVWES